MKKRENVVEELKKVETEKEYWQKHKEMKKDIKKLFRSSYKLMHNPNEFIKKYDLMLSKYEFIGVISSEWADEQRIRLFNEMNKPEEFKDWVSDVKKGLSEKKKRTINKIKSAFKK